VPKRLRVIFFDAGNTLVFTNLERTLSPLHARGIKPSREQLHASERAAKRKLDAGDLTLDHSHSVDFNYWHVYYSQLLESMGIDDDQLRAALIAATRQSGSWDYVMPGTRAILDRLRADYQLAVISNSDGGIADLLYRCGIGACFNSITDSAKVGCEKPNAKIFQAALDTMGVAPAESLHIGDVYSVDYLGAKGVGMNALLFDVAGVYRDRPLPRISSLEELAPALEQLEE
jgi:putative hydrolase of the HAD superfamily